MRAHCHRSLCWRGKDRARSAYTGSYTMQVSLSNVDFTEVFCLSKYGGFKTKVSSIWPFGAFGAVDCGRSVNLETHKALPVSAKNDQARI